MNNYLPPPQAVSDAYTLLALIADPASAKTHLDEIATREAALAQGHADLAAQTAQVSTDKVAITSATSALSVQKANLDAQSDALVKAKIDADARSMDLAQREGAVSQKEQALTNAVSAHKEAVDAHANDHAAREAGIVAAETKVAQTASAATALKAQYEDKIAKLKNIAG